MNNNKKAVILLSGGLDSSTLLALTLDKGYQSHCISFVYGQRHNIELESAKKITKNFNCSNRHKIITIDLKSFGNSALTDEIEVPKDRPIDTIGSGKIPITYVPARNTIFLSYALAYAEVIDACDIFIGANIVDYSGYPDCRPQFVEAFNKLANLAIAKAVEGQKITIHAPLMKMNKVEIIQTGLKLGVNYADTLSCYDPDENGYACGKCDACILRLNAFKELNLTDPAKYKECNDMDHSPLGQKTTYKDKYSKSLLFPVPRKIKRQELGIRQDQLPFYGYDIWNAYEISWLNSELKPEVRIAEIIFPAHNKNIVESKSLKLYLNSFNNSQFDSESTVKNLIINDLLELVQGEAIVRLFSLDKDFYIEKPKGSCIDHIRLELNNDNKLEAKKLLLVEKKQVEENLYSNLFKSNCPVTNQPDWATIFISYKGKKLCHQSLLEYLISYRNCNEFHEQCVERIFLDIQKITNPIKLSVYARYTRRGGIDINPIRSLEKINISDIANIRLARQ